jgi:uncharacterized protein with HEPN domain
MAEDKIPAVLQDLLEATNRMMVSTEQMTDDVFLADLKTQEAVVRTLEILGEATQQISDEFRQHAPHIPKALRPATDCCGLKNSLTFFGLAPQTGRISNFFREHVRRDR